jgi:hypothetical protein
VTSCSLNHWWQNTALQVSLRKEKSKYSQRRSPTSPHPEASFFQCKDHAGYFTFTELCIMNLCHRDKLWSSVFTQAFCTSYGNMSSENVPRSDILEVSFSIVAMLLLILLCLSFIYEFLDKKAWPFSHNLHTSQIYCWLTPLSVLWNSRGEIMERRFDMIKIQEQSHTCRVQNARLLQILSEMV